jgi:hypothetical protein
MLPIFYQVRTFSLLFTNLLNERKSAVDEPGYQVVGWHPCWGSSASQLFDTGRIYLILLISSLNHQDIKQELGNNTTWQRKAKDVSKQCKISVDCGDMERRYKISEDKRESG